MAYLCDIDLCVTGRLGRRQRSRSKPWRTGWRPSSSRCSKTRLTRHSSGCCLNCKVSCALFCDSCAHTFVCAEREDALKVEVKTSQDSTVKKLAALVAKSSDVMSEEVEARVVVPSEDEGSDSEDKVSTAKKRRLVPSENQISMWADARRVSADFNKDDWKEVSASRILKDYSEHPDAVSFKAHQVDGEVSLSYQNQRDAEKILKTLEMQFGAIGAASTLLFEQVGQVNDAARRAARQFASSQGSQEELLLQARQFSEDIMVRGCC